MTRNFYNIIIFLIVFASTSCSSSFQGHWVTTIDGQTRIWITNPDSSLTYQWEGENFDSVAHDSGVLITLKDKAIIEKKQIKAFYGALAMEDVACVTENETYVGGIDNDLFSGYGVYNKGSEVYVGHFKESKPNGYATWYKNGKPYYIGMWRDGKFHGEGTLYKEDGSIKTGDWENGTLIQTQVDVYLKNGHYNGYVKNNKPDGDGRMDYADGSIYSGNWKNGVYNGYGVLVTFQGDTISSNWELGSLDGATKIKSKGLLYTGDYLEGYPHGLCYVTIPDVYSYKGYMQDGVKSGYGELSLPSGDYYKGDWDNNVFDGEGLYYYSSQKATYDGQWSNGLQDGIGYYKSPLFAYRGEWEEGWINGYGKIVFSNKDQYLGNFVENKFWGIGTYLYSNGNRYEGEFVNGEFNGLGTFYFANGDVYCGEFKDGHILGDGTLTILENGKPITITAFWPGGNKFPSKGSILFSNGDIFEGELNNGIPTQNGIWTSESLIEKNQAWSDKANAYYKAHKEEFEKISNALTYVAIGVGVAAAITGAAVSIAATGGAAAPAALIAVNSVLATASTTVTAINTVTYAGNIVASAASAAVDYNNSDNEDEKSEILKSTGINLAVDAAFMVAPKVAKSSAARAAKVALSKGLKEIGKKTVISISKNKTFGKIVKVVKGKSNTFEKQLSKANRNTVNSTVKKGKEKFQSLLLKGLIKRTKLYKTLQTIMAKEAINLSEKELNELLNNPKYLRAYIKTYTGDHRNFQEFFIRLAMGNKTQVKKILDQPDIRKYIDRSIRQSGEGGVHEWLMTKNFKSFLTDTKWGDDGPFLALALTKLVQSTERVMFRNGGRHPSSIASNSSESSMFHQRLAEVIDACSSKEELLVKVRAFAKKELTEEAYQEFNEIFKTVFVLSN